MATIRLRVDRKLEVYELSELYTQVKNNTCNVPLTTSQVKRILQLGAKLEKGQRRPNLQNTDLRAGCVMEIPDQGIAPEYIKSLFAEANVN